jgi:hypothetical protein
VVWLENPFALKGRGFSRAISSTKASSALAAEGFLPSHVDLVGRL